MIKKWIVSLAVFVFFTSLFAQDPAIEYSKAMDRLNQGKELYFLIHLNAPTDIKKINEILSIDKIEDNYVYAYANKKEFESFLQLNLVYEVKTNPGDLIDFECSDYVPTQTATKSLMASAAAVAAPTFTAWPTYDGLLNLTKQYETDFPDLCKLYDVGTTVQGRKIQCLVLTSKVKTSLKPRVLLVGPPHGDELTGVMLSFRLYSLLVTKYAEGDARVRRILDSIEIWSVPLLNLDGTYKGGNNTVTGAQRANANGVDLNRSYPGGPGITPAASPQAETIALRAFLKSFNNNFTMGVDLHGGIEAFQYPWGGKSADHHEKTWYHNTGTTVKNASSGGFSKGVGSFAAMLGYLGPGCFNDYGCYHVNGMKAFCFELSTTKLIATSQFDLYWNMYQNALLTFIEIALTGVQGVVTDSTTGAPIKDVSVFAENYDTDSSWVTTYPDGGYYKLIPTGTYSLTFSHKDFVTRTITGVSATNLQKTVLHMKLLANSDLPPVDTIFIDNFETNKNWVRNPNGTDKATSGTWERADPAQTTSSGIIYQQGTTASGTYGLVTGPLAGTGIDSYDIDGGVTSIKSPSITLPVAQQITLSFKYYLSHATTSTVDDFLRVHVAGVTTTKVFEELGAANVDAASWVTFSCDISSFSNQVITLLVEAADNGTASTVEGAIDDVVITAIKNNSNQTPTVNAGFDQTIVFPTTSITMNPTLSDDGKPNPPGSLTLTWSLVSGPAAVTFSNPAIANTIVDFTAEGVYEFQLTAFDGELSASDNVFITVSATPINQAPQVNAGVDKTVTLPNTLQLVGTASDDGLPNPPGALSLTWSQQSGPATAVFSNANALSTTVTFPASGSYILKLTAHDGQYTVSDNVSVTVSAAGPDTLFFDNFETNKGWTVNPAGTDNATIGKWERADPAQTTYNSVIYQLGTTASGTYDLVTGPLAGTSVGSYDIDGGKTSIRSPSIQLPTAQTITLSFKYYMAHTNNSAAEDYLRCSVVGGTVTKVLEELGAANNDAATWATFTYTISAYAGQSIYLLIEAADVGTASTVECAIDDVRIIAQ